MISIKRYYSHLTQGEVSLDPEAQGYRCLLLKVDKQMRSLLAVKFCSKSGITMYITPNPLSLMPRSLKKYPVDVASDLFV